MKDGVERTDERAALVWVAAVELREIQRELDPVQVDEGFVCAGRAGRPVGV